VSTCRLNLLFTEASERVCVHSFYLGSNGKNVQINRYQILFSVS